MFKAVMWWLAQVAGGGAIAYLLMWGNNTANTKEPFRQFGRIAIVILIVVFLICMIFRLFTLLGHPIA